MRVRARLPGSVVREDDLRMATTRPEPATPNGRAPVKKKRNPWIWVSVVLALAAAGLLIWALTVQSDLDSTQKQVSDLESQVEQGQSAGGTLVTAAKGVIDDLSAELGATSDDLEQTQQELDDAKQQADDAEQAADDATDETARLKAEAEAAEAKAGIAADCARAYVSAIGAAFDGGGADVRSQLQSITADCKTALADG
jgi:hypothetical protein